MKIDTSALASSLRIGTYDTIASWGHVGGHFGIILGSRRAIGCVVLKNRYILAIPFTPYLDFELKSVPPETQ